MISYNFFNRKTVTIIVFEHDIYTKKVIRFLKNFNFEKINIVYSLRKNKKIYFKKKQDFIFIFKSKIILTKKNLENFNYAINFHSGPSKYPGVGAYSRCIINGDKKYGTTVHLINKKIDNGKIILEKNFLIKKTIKVNELIQLSYKEHFKLFKSFLTKFNRYGPNYIKINLKKNKNLKWGKRFKISDLEKIKKINPSSNLKKLNRIIRATFHGIHKPYIIIKNKKFIYNEEK